MSQKDNTIPSFKCCHAHTFSPTELQMVSSIISSYGTGLQSGTPYLHNSINLSLFHNPTLITAFWHSYVTSSHHSSNSPFQAFLYSTYSPQCSSSFQSFQPRLSSNVFVVRCRLNNRWRAGFTPFMLQDHFTWWNVKCYHSLAYYIRH